MTNTELVEKWQRILQYVQDAFQKKPDLNAILFLIGIRELGTLYDTDFSKEDKVMLIHIAVCKILSYSGHYELEGFDVEGWPKWKLLKPMPQSEVFEQELFLKQHVVTYFEKERIIEF